MEVTLLNKISCKALSGIGPRMAEKLAKLHIHTVQDLLFHLPFRYQDRTRITPLNRLIVGEHAVIEAEIQAITQPKYGKTKLFCKLTDGKGFLNLRFFYPNHYKQQQVTEGMRLRCFGEVRFGPQGLEMVHPEYFPIQLGMPLTVEKTLTPIYPATEGLSQVMIRKLTDRALECLNKNEMVEIIPEEVLQKLAFPKLGEAIRFVHRPPAEESVEKLSASEHPYQQRLVFEELLAHRLSLVRSKKKLQGVKAVMLSAKNNLREQFLKQLPFQLTNAQLRVGNEIEKDLERAFPMLRLVQGDVGSGKTIVAALAVLRAIENGYQSAIIAPTEILTEQHFINFQKWLLPLKIKVALLSGQLKAAERKQTLASIAAGEIDVVIGTHAVFQKDVVFPKLALVVVDEQHRFGVEQRTLLREKGMYGDCYPHQLIMTATPIPRTLAMSVYADLDCSVIDELPPGRTPISTSVIPNTRRDEMLTRIREACREGRQAYWVCTLIEESEVLQCRAAEDTAKQLMELLSELKIGLIHGRMKSQEKELVMSQFKTGQIHLLVATTVIEVGVDVPNASLMIIENAERLGLAQLHQLRGRVGRGSRASHCVLMYQIPLSLLAKSRLSVMRETHDGFKIAERDLALRGPGEVLGTRQTGDVQLRIADLLRDSELLPKVQEASDLILNKYPHLIDEFVTRWLGNKEHYSNV